jgi:hypothetical protein
MQHDILFFVSRARRWGRAAAAAWPAAALLATSSTASGAERFPQPKHWPQILAARVQAEPLGPGVTYEQWHLATSAGPLDIHLARVRPFHPYVGFRVTTADGVLSGSGETLSSMAARLHAELGINGDYFDINGTGMPENVVVTDGRLIHSPDPSVACMVARGGGLYIGHVWLDAGIETPRGPFAVSAVNDWRPNVERFLLTPQASRTPVDVGSASVAWLTQNGKPEDFLVTRVERAVTRVAPLRRGERAVVVRGPTAAPFAALLRPGQRIRLHLSLRPRLGEPVEQAIGGGPMVLAQGRVARTSSPPASNETYVRNPVSGIGISADGSRAWLVVVDGRNPGRSIGLTRPELGELFLALGARSAMAFDSGGSSEIVVRPLGELTAAVANHPSDGRERRIADALFVVNTAPAGPARRLLLRAHPAIVGPQRFDAAHSVEGTFVGSSVRLAVSGVDGHGQPVALSARQVRFVLTSSVARLREGNVLTGMRPGRVTVRALAGRGEGSQTLDVVDRIARLSLVGADHVPTGGRTVLGLIARDAAGRLIAVDPAAVSWTAQGGATIFVGGLLIAGDEPGRYVVSARVGGAVARKVVFAGEHQRVVQAFPPASADADGWRLACVPVALCGTLDFQGAPDGGSALHLQYDLSRQPADRTRAAMAQAALAIPGRPLAVLVDVYGDGNGVWLRAGYRTALGVRESITLARHVAWVGWREVRVPLPEQSAWPLTWTALYVVVPPHEGAVRGNIWFRNLRFAYPGPAP